MPTASDVQVQRFSDERLRVRAEQFRALVLACQSDKAAIDDIYAACAQGSPTWHDSRTDGPPHLLGPQDILVFNALVSLFLKVIDGTATAQDVQDFHGNWAVFQAACVRPVAG